MTVLIVSDDPRIVKLFSSFDGKKMALLTVARSALIKNCKCLGNDLAFVWYDIASLESSGLKAAFKTLSKLSVPWGIIDRKGVLEDASGAFWAGASDYIGSKTDAASITIQRLNKALCWANSKIAASDSSPLTVSETKIPSSKREDFIDSSTGWNSIKEGCSYTFTFVYVQIDKAERLLETLGEIRLNNLDQEFQRMVEQAFVKRSGLVWMWRDYGGLLLLPFDGKVCPAILDALNLWLNRPIIYAGNSALSVTFSFRMAIHIGNTVFKRPGKTGDLTSDALNSIFHLGARFMKNNTLYLTEEAALFIPPKISDLFVNAGTYEGRSIKRMLALI